MTKYKITLLSVAALAPLALAAPVAAGPSDPSLTGYLGATSKSEFARNALERLNAKGLNRKAEHAADRIVLWHDVLLDTIAIDLTPDPDTGIAPADQVGPTRGSRAQAMTMIAVFDAVNAFENRFVPYNEIPAPKSNASIDVAIAYAAHDTLVALFPDQAGRLGMILANDLAQIKASGPKTTRGRTVGQNASAAILARRTGDGSVGPENNFGGGGQVADGATTFFGTPVNGGTSLTFEWTPDPLTPDPSQPSGIFQLALGSFWGAVTPFTLSSGDQFRAPPPPAPGSPEFNAAFDEVAAVGGSPDNAGTPSTGTNETRFIGNYWGYDAVPMLGTPPRLYAQIAIQVAEAQELRDPVELARYLALIHTVQADSGVSAWDSKYFYNYYRPVTGVRIDDGVAETANDPSWDPFGVSVINTTDAIRATPPFPAYPSGHATFGAAVFEIMRSYFGNDTPFTFISDEYNGEGVDPFGVPRPLVPVRFETLQQAQEENGQSRVFNGVHWQYDNTAGQDMGVSISQHVLNDIEEFSRR